MPRAISISVLLSASLLAQNASLRKYKVLNIDVRHEAAATPLNQAADEGYRLLFGYRFAVMRLDAMPPDTYRYLPVPEFRGRSSMLNALNQQGALGYRWRGDVAVLEKEPHPHNYEYQGAEGFTMNARDRSYESLLMEGFEPVSELMPGQIVIREIGGAPARPPREVRTVEAGRKSNLLKKISELASRGYRYSAPQFAGAGGGNKVLMEACDSSCGGPYEYRAFAVDNAAQLERDLNQFGNDGFHVVARSLDRSPSLVERPANRVQKFVYRIFEATDERSIEQALNEGDRDGFVPLGATAHVGWNVHVFMVLEKATSVAP